MLVELYLESFVIFNQVKFVFSQGLNAISGETGAGKSLVAKALALALGERGGYDSIRHGEDEARIKAIFDLNDEKLILVLKNNDIKIDGNKRIVLERVLRKEGTSKLLINNKQVSAQVVRHILPLLVDFSAQNEQIRLAEPVYQLEVLDKFGNLTNKVNIFNELFSQAGSLQKRLQLTEEEIRSINFRLEGIKQHIALIDSIDYDSNTDPYLEEVIKEKTSKVDVAQAAIEVLNIFADKETSLRDSLLEAKRKLNKIIGSSEIVKLNVENIDNMLVQLNQITGSLEKLVNNYDVTPNELDSLIERSEQIKKIAKKLNCSTENLDDVYKNLLLEAEKLENWHVDEHLVQEELDKVLEKLIHAGLELRKEREKAALKLAKAVNKELAELGMPQAAFSVDFELLFEDGDDKKDILKKISSHGLESITFLLAPNIGESAAKFSHNASGGESARTLLAIKAALADSYCPPVMFFDEVDAGVGGRLGDVLGKKLQYLASSRQVIVITHLPQIAAHAKKHLKISKTTNKKRTEAFISDLVDNERIEEIAQMIHGSSATEITKEQAVNMLRQAAS